MRMTKKQRDAQDLYLLGMSYNRIAGLLGVHAKTVSRWAAKYNWQKLSEVHEHSLQKELPRLLRQLSEFNDFIESKEHGLRFGTSSEYDALAKLKKAIVELSSTPLQTKVSIMSDFMRYADEINHELAVEIAEIADSYIKREISND